MPPLSEFLNFAAVGRCRPAGRRSAGHGLWRRFGGHAAGAGLPPLVASASVHYAETFTCGASGLSHLAAGNVRRRLFLALALPGVVGAVIGAYVVSHGPSAWMRLALAPYLLGMGVFLLPRRARRADGHGVPVPAAIRPLGLIACFADAVAGGGWSALVVTTLVARGVSPRTAIGTAHLAKCVVSAAASVSFLLHARGTHGTAMPGLIVGGVAAAPLGALFARRMPARVATVLAATAVLVLGLNNVVRAWH